MPPATYAAVVLYFRLGAAVETTLSALQGQTLRPSSMLVVDNASGDGIVAEVIQSQPGVRMLVLPENRGYAGGMNAGAAEVAASAPDYLLFLTHEATLPPEGVERLIALANTSQAAIVAPTLVDADGSVFSRGGRFTRWGTATHLRAAGTAAEIEWLDGAALLVRRSVFESIGGFDDTFFLYWEDVDFTDRAKRLGSLQVASDVLVEQSQRGMPTYLNAWGRTVYWRKRRRFALVVMAPLAILLRSIYAALYCTATRTPRPPVNPVAIVGGFADARSGVLRMEELEL